MPEFRKGENVRYKPVGGMAALPLALLSFSKKSDELGPESKTSEAFGTIQEVSTENTNLTGRNVEASDDEPRYEVSIYYPQGQSSMGLTIADCE